MKVKFSDNCNKSIEFSYQKTLPDQVTNPKLLILNKNLADFFNIDFKDSKEIELFLSGNKLFENGKYISRYYSGHQFGNFVHNLGDGRAVEIGDIFAKDDCLHSIQLKGSGKTVFSRRGDGRASLGSVIREYLLSEYMYKINIPTTRGLAIITTDNYIQRDKLLPMAIMVRTSRNFLRVGTFQFFVANHQESKLPELIRYVIDRNFKDIKSFDLDNKFKENLYINFYEKVIELQAKLIAKWMNVGFIHGVMNSDNMSIIGETIDYGPCAFMDYFDISQCYSSIDIQKRYCYGNQPNMAMWNLSRLAECFIDLVDKDELVATNLLTKSLTSFEDKYLKYKHDYFLQKIGIEPEIDIKDDMLISELLNIMQSNRMDFTLTFRYLSYHARKVIGKDYVLNDVVKTNDLFFSKIENLEHLKFENSEFRNWISKWLIKLENSSINLCEISINMDRINPILIPRNHVIEEIILEAYKNKFTRFFEFIELSENPYQIKTTDRFFNTESSINNFKFYLPPEIIDPNYRTFCGT